MQKKLLYKSHTTDGPEKVSLVGVKRIRDSRNRENLSEKRDMSFPVHVSCDTMSY